MPAWVVFLLLQTLWDGDDDCKANLFVFIITIPALAHILHAKCLSYIYFYFYFLDGNKSKFLLGEVFQAV